MTSPLPFPTDPWQALAARWQQLAQEWRHWWLPGSPTPDAAAPMPMPAWLAAYDPQAVAALNDRFAPRIRALWATAREAKPAPAMDPAPPDRRFAAPAWREQPFFALLKDAYLLYSEYLTELAELARLPSADKQRLRFATQQYLDAIAPTNFPATNPEVLQRAIETEGESLLTGISNLLEDARKGRISMSDESAFAAGRNLATTPGSVVFRNDLIELIQYDATTPTVHRRPLLMVPPCINKFYILDLRPENSFVCHAVAQGHTTFMISWRNIPPELGNLTWNDYLDRGVLAAIRAAQEIADSKTINALGFCVGGTLLACALAVLAARHDSAVASATFLTTMLDFADPGEIGVYVSREFLAAREPALLAGQRVHGGELASAFASLRANDLVWHYVVNNYLKGQSPPAFDLLHWNGDSANLPGPMYVYYLKEMYLDNRLREPGALTMLGERIDLAKVAMPAYVMATREDHIVPWRTAYRTTSLVGGDATFVLGASGHIAGVVNPPSPLRRNYWTHDVLTDEPDAWLARAHSHPGSWWPHWYAWLAQHAGARHPAPTGAGSDRYPPLEAAPGSYVLAPAG
jgi:poly[(R)-3-hydroxyalkanoate] polymerase subunit PhaC